MSRINIEQFATLTDTVPDGDLEVNVTLTLKYSLEKHRIAANLSFAFSNDTARIMLLDLACEFEIQPDDWDAAVKDSKLVIPKFALETFVAQAVGTARGILHCKTEGTPFNGIILPPINVTELVTGDMAVPIG